MKTVIRTEPYHVDLEQIEAEIAKDSPAAGVADVTEFMSTRGHYLLYGEAVHPMSLTVRRGTAKD